MKWATRVQKYVNYETAEQAALSGQFQWIQPKYDGWWACVAIRRGRAYIYSRQGVLKNTSAVRQTDIDCVLIGEYLVGTQRAASIGEAKGQFVAFDMVERHGKCIGDRPYLERSDFAQRFAEHEQWMLPVQNYGIRSHSKVWRELVASGDAEGLVFRSMHDTYGDSVIGRVKRTFTMDYVVMGVERGQGRHSGRAGAVICGLYEGRKLVEKVRVGGGWTDAQRDELFANPKAFIGRVLEVKGWQVFDSGSMRHPNAVRFRDDKKAKECVFRV
jgi:ATP-dependent DNA ligase